MVEIATMPTSGIGNTAARAFPSIPKEPSVDILRTLANFNQNINTNVTRQLDQTVSGGPAGSAVQAVGSLRKP